MQLTQSIKTILVLAIILTALVGYQYTGAQWSAAPANPPSNNVAAPINEGSTSQIKLGALGTGALSVTGALAVSGAITGGGTLKTTGDLELLDSSPSIRMFDTDTGDRKFWIQTNSNIFYILADRNNDGSYIGDTPYPLQIFAGTDAANDYALFSDQVRAGSFCDKAGGNCFTSAEVGTMPTITPQFFAVAGAAIDTTKTMSMGVQNFCALSTYKTTSDDNNNFDGCEVKKVGSVWSLILTKEAEDTLLCRAVCF